MKINMKSIALSTALVASTVAMAQAKVNDTITVAILATENNAELKKRWEPFVADMKKALGVNVKAFYANDYNGIIQAMRFGKVDICMYGNKSAIEAVDRAGGEVFGKALNADGSDGYFSYLITHKDNNKLNSLDDVIKHKASLTFGNGDPNSTSGFLVPSYYVFAKHNLKYSEFKRVLNSSHGNNQLAVVNKKVDFATNNNINMGNLKKAHPEKFKQIKVIWQSPVIPSDPLVWRKDLNADTKKAIFDFYMTYPKAGYKSNVEFKFVPGHNLQLTAIRQLKAFKEMNSAKKAGKKDEAMKLQESLYQYDRDAAYLNLLTKGAK